MVTHTLSFTPFKEIFYYPTTQCPLHWHYIIQWELSKINLVPEKSSVSFNCSVSKALETGVMPLVLQLHLVMMSSLVLIPLILFE